MIFRLFHVYFSFLWKRFLALAKFFAQNFSFVCSFTPSTCYFPPGLNLRANIWMKPVPPVAVFVHTTHGCPADHVLRIKLCESTFLYYNVCSTKCQKNKGWVEKNLPKLSAGNICIDAQQMCTLPISCVQNYKEYFTNMILKQ